ncbi:hypothetical protein E2562_021086 [Oryza meyeriana var. granulata]|uniref:Uncharacterized protein n=1 Tax=Oryza meyeriana var. granulata TaxID=110450 RepID=A0A6G1BM83_9ORYZ|nr:hypothetical protein E2562_021086 [Oryza meyeriana var. granulata]
MLGPWSGRARTAGGWWREAEWPTDDCGAARPREAAEQAGLAGGRARVAGWWLSELEWPAASHRELVWQRSPDPVEVGRALPRGQLISRTVELATTGVCQERVPQLEYAIEVVVVLGGTTEAESGELAR